MKAEKATFGAGCFWHVEEEFRRLEGVTQTTVGYMGGKLDNPTYEDVCSDRTGHIEVCQLEYNPDMISYEGLLAVFWKIHDPTEYNRQGPDVGSQYKSAIFFHDKEQKESAMRSLKNEQKNHDRKIATVIRPAGTFYKAEDYHQKYLMRRDLKTC